MEKMRIELSKLSDKELEELIPNIKAEQEARLNDRKNVKWKAVVKAMKEYIDEFDSINFNDAMVIIDKNSIFSTPGEIWEC